MCGICLDEFQLVHSPLNATKLRPTASSTELPFGMTLGCPSEHAYCQACLVQYIQTKIDPANDGSGSVDAVVFPIRCPECPIDVWEVGVTDDVAERVLSEKGMLLWVCSALSHWARLCQLTHEHFVSINKDSWTVFPESTARTRNARPLFGLTRTWMKLKRRYHARLVILRCVYPAEQYGTKVSGTTMYTIVLSIFQ